MAPGGATGAVGSVGAVVRAQGSSAVIFSIANSLDSAVVRMVVYERGERKGDWEILEIGGAVRGVLTDRLTAKIPRIRIQSTAVRKMLELQSAGKFATSHRVVKVRPGLTGVSQLGASILRSWRAGDKDKSGGATSGNIMPHKL